MRLRFQTDASELDPRVVPSLGFKREKYEKRTRDPVAFIVHTTGYGPIRRFESSQRERFEWETPFDAALFIYEQIMKAGPHWVIGQRKGEIAQVCPEDLCAWHVGGRGGWVYRKKRWSNRNTEWWEKQWHPMTTPREFANGMLWAPYDPAPSLLKKITQARFTAWRAKGSVNANTIGVEVVPNKDDPSGAWSDEAWENLAKVIVNRAEAHSIELTPTTVLTHSSAHPRARSRNNTPWDTWPDQFTWEEFERWSYYVDRIKPWCPPA